MALGLLNSTRPTTDSPLSSELALALRRAISTCEKSKLQFTELRQQVFSIIFEADKPIGAYEIMAKLEVSSNREKVAPPTVYRTVDFLCRHNMIIRVHSLNAYLPKKTLNSDDKICALFICSSCGNATEAPSNSVQQNLNLVANELKFQIEQQSLEIIGVCQRCEHQK